MLIVGTDVLTAVSMSIDGSSSGSRLQVVTKFRMDIRLTFRTTQGDHTAQDPENKCEISGAHGSEYEDDNLLEYSTPLKRRSAQGRIKGFVAAKHFELLGTFGDSKKYCWNCSVLSIIRVNGRNVRVIQKHG
jgi:hypothetical protein